MFENASSKDLTHHGVKGMRWGVRHDRDRTGGGKKKFGSDKEKTGHGYVNPTQDLGRDEAKIKNDWYGHVQIAEKIDKRLGAAQSLVAWTNTALHDELGYYSKFTKDLKNGYSNNDPNLNKWLKDFKKATSIELNPSDDMARVAYLANYGVRNDGEMSDEEWEELEDLTEIYEALLEYYNGTYVGELLKKEESEMAKEQKKFRDTLSKAMEDNNVQLIGNQKISVENVNGRKSWVYTKDSGKYGWSEPVESEDGLQKVLNAAKADSEELKDFRNRKSSTRTRQKNVSGKAVSIKKGRSINVSDEERQSKIASSKKSQEETRKAIEFLMNVGITQKDARKNQTKKFRNYKPSNRR